MRLILNNIFIPLDGDNIYQTKQINTLAKLDNRQSNLTNTIKVKKTREVIRALDMLGIIGNTSNKPYEINNANLLYDSGEPFIYNGRAVINSVDNDYFNITIYDGNLDMFADMQNDKLNVVNLVDLTHEKTVSNVVNSMNQELKYRYMLADFGGKTETNKGFLNIDWLAPFASVPYIWEQIFKYYGYTYECNVFNSQEWTNLWLSYPKGTFKSGVSNSVFKGKNLGAVTFPSKMVLFNSQDMPTLTTTVQPQSDFNGNIYNLLINQTGTYILKVKAQINRANLIAGQSQSKSFLYYCKNGQSINPSLVQPTGVIYTSFGTNLPTNEEVNAEVIVQLVAGETVSFKWDVKQRWETLDPVEIEILKYEADIVDFSDAFKTWTVKDFINEIVVRFGLTYQKDKYTKHYVFKSTNEITSKENFIDWSDKYDHHTNVRFVYDDYCKNNIFRYKYQDETEDHFNGNIPVDNENLKPEDTAFQSKTFAPSKTLLGNYIWKMYNREIKDNGQIDYKNLNDRFFFATSAKVTINPVKLASDYQNEVFTIQTVYNPLFKFQDWNYILPKYYGGIFRILRNSRIYSAYLRLKPSDIINIDLMKMAYIDKLNGYFVINFIDKYHPDNILTAVELIQVDRFDPDKDQPPTGITFDDGTTFKPCVPDSTKPIRVTIGGINQSDSVTLKPVGREVLTRINANTFELAEFDGTVLDFSLNGKLLNQLKIN